MTYTIKDLKNNAVKVIYLSQTRLVIKLDNQRFIITPAIDDHSYDEPVAFLEYETLDND